MSIKTRAFFVVMSILAGTNIYFSQASEVHLRAKPIKSVSMDPQDKAWKKIPSVTIPLVKQTFVAPQGGGSVKQLEVKCVRTAKEIFFRLEWEDKTKNSILDIGGKFSDGCAVQLPLKDGDWPSPFMGSKDRPVNIWYWRSAAKEPNRYVKAYSDFHRQDAIEQTIQFDDRSVQNLTAEGFGSLTSQSDSTLQGAGVWKDDQWSVVIKRDFETEGGAVLKDHSAVPISFAVWDGSNLERDGAKSLSLWHFLLLGDAKIKLISDTKERGKRVLARYGCETCHGLGGAGGVKSRNASGGEVPPLNRLSEGFTEEEVKQIIKHGRSSVPEDGSGPFPSLHMTNWDAVMDERELDDLVKFLFSISKKSEEW